MGQELPTADYKIVRLANGVHSLHSVAHRETFHPVIGPVAEARALYVDQLRLRERLSAHPDGVVIWDVGLGAAANPLAVLRATGQIKGRIQLVSFDHTTEPLQFAVTRSDCLDYLLGYESYLKQLAAVRHVRFLDHCLSVDWQLCLADFPTLLMQPKAAQIPKPHAIMFDAYSPARNPAMWTQPLFANLFRLLDPKRPCALPTYSRSTMLRVSLLLAGFYVGSGHATGEKEETTIAANTLDLINEPLDRRWLQRARKSTSAEPLWEPVYRQAPLRPETWEKLREHSQFSAS